MTDDFFEKLRDPQKITKSRLVFDSLEKIEMALDDGRSKKEIADALEIKVTLFYPMLTRARAKREKLDKLIDQKKSVKKKSRAASAATENHPATLAGEPVKAKNQTKTAEFDLTTYEGRRAAQAARFKRKDDD